MSCKPTPSAPSFPTRSPSAVEAGESGSFPDGTVVQTVAHETDARTALMRGMVEYLRTLTVAEPGGRELRFETVVEGQAVPDESTKFPWCCVSAPEESRYSGGMVPRVTSDNRIPAPEKGDREVYAVPTANFDTTLSLTFVCEKEERIHLMRMLEADLQFPDRLRQGKYGVTVELPFYMGMRADYAPVSSQYVDSSGDARQARFGGVMKVSASLKVARIVERPRAKPMLSTSVR